MGTERRSMIINEDEKRNTAYHEAGHALVAKLIPGTDPIHKVTIIPRGRALGLTQQLPTDEKHTYARDFLESTLAMLLGGTGGRRTGPQPHDHGRGQRYRKGHGTGPQDGLRMGHERRNGTR